ncbi:uncharacterized protein LODBEIA_P18500 [Lodderomyces beijingensis]|uniref:Protein kinase domain-containing protein n=1 Tax=Lodderomyces beijingensis TaxID=1775926 RepID=A0ABP0ZKH7_9ASCO
MSAPQLKEVRSPIDQDGLRAYLSKLTSSTSDKNNGAPLQTIISHNAHLPASYTTIKQFTFGQSNPTYYLEDASGRSFVLRRKPTQNAKLVSKSAHAIEREFYILNAINILNESARLKIPVPRVHLLCEDESVLGYVFYIMDYVQGIQIKNPALLPAIEESDTQTRETIWRSITETAAAIHLLDAEALIQLLPPSHFPQFQNLAKLKKSSYFSRQLRTLTQIHQKQSEYVDPIPDFDKITSFLAWSAPPDPEKLSLVHGDFKIDNLLFDPVTYQVVAVLDWELCTIGHPLFDLANFLQLFAVPNQLAQMLMRPVKATIGKEDAASQEFLVHELTQYSRLANWGKGQDPVELWTVGHVFGLLRLCVISQGIAMRVKQGNASSANAEMFASAYPTLSGLCVDDIDEFESSVAKNKSKI